MIDIVENHYLSSYFQVYVAGKPAYIPDFPAIYYTSKKQKQLNVSIKTTLLSVEEKWNDICNEY